MSIPTTRDEFKAYCLRSLGAPVLQINVDDTQIEDRIDEAIYMFQQYHMDAVQTSYLKHQITASTMGLTSNTAYDFTVGERLIGTNNYNVSTANGFLLAVTSANTIQFATDVGTFGPGDTIHGDTSNVTATISSSNSAITTGDFDNKYITVPDTVVGVTRIFNPFDSRMSADILFDPQSQFNMSLMANFTSYSIIPYYVARSYQQLLNDMFRGRPGMRFQRHMNRLYVDVNWHQQFLVGHWLIVECFQTINPTDYPLVWSDRWLQRYASALMKKQWGSNLSKYGQISLPGGVTLDGKSMFSEAITEIKELEDNLKNEYTIPPNFIVG